MRDLGLVFTHGQIQLIIKYHVFGWLPVLPATVALMMRVADYFTDIWVLESLSKEYKIPLESLMLMKKGRVRHYTALQKRESLC